MNSLPVPVAPASLQDNDAIGHLPAALTDALRAAEEFARSASSDSTRRAYAADWRHFEEWCAANKQEALEASPAIVAAYLSALVGEKRHASTISRRAAGIAFGFKRHGLEPPTASIAVRAVLKGIRNRLGTRPTKKAPLTADLIGKIVRKITDGTPKGLRDRALILVGFAGALRRSELVALNVEDLEWRSQGVLVHVRRSKGDQEGKGQTVAIPFGRKLAVVDALRAWLKSAGIASGPLFRPVRKGGRVEGRALNGAAVAAIVKEYVGGIGRDPELFAGHSLRSGFATTAGRKNLAAASDHLRHAKLDTTRGYVAHDDAFADHAGKGFL